MPFAASLSLPLSTSRTPPLSPSPKLVEAAHVCGRPSLGKFGGGRRGARGAGTLSAARSLFISECVTNQPESIFFSFSQDLVMKAEGGRREQDGRSGKGGGALSFTAEKAKGPRGGGERPKEEWRASSGHGASLERRESETITPQNLILITSFALHPHPLRQSF
ncbi:hypothetical protein IE53DRAFT_127857 [Violaceomyces palustris]|uniref:Uncharacterized protein n=1 Tax=Violaceomyces palustris TaxID=1673888 RepID=A0ACD0NVM7_9BASI|nr:hypothetical protein IE53DRAFT_127857 [Violaceomyces palustris]